MAEAMRELERLLSGRERQEPPPTLSEIWPHIKQWAAMPVTDAPGPDADLMLYETALSLKPASKHHSPPHFWIGITRQFAPDDQEVEGICIALEYEPDDDLAATVTMDHADMGFGAQTWGVSSTDEIRDLGTATPRAARSWSAAVEHDPAFKLIIDRPPRQLSVELGGG
jgi:hypothetical protein